MSEVKFSGITQRSLLTHREDREGILSFVENLENLTAVDNSESFLLKRHSNLVILHQIPDMQCND